MKITQFQMTPTALITNTEVEKQKVILSLFSDFNGHVELDLFHDGTAIIEKMDLVLSVGSNQRSLFTIPPTCDVQAQAILTLPDGNRVCWNALWKKPREWELYFVLSSHTDIGLHNSPYIQRSQSAEFIDDAIRVSEEAREKFPDLDYHYMVEGTWIWNNYAADRGKAQAEKVRDQYIKKGTLGLFSGIAGNFTQVFGLEEMCRAAGNRRELLDQWQIHSRTLEMADNNGLSWAMVAPYAEAGYENILFAPNQWAPLRSTLWQMDPSVDGSEWNPEAGGGGSRIDVRYKSALPMVFYWLAPDQKSKLLVWASTQYGWGGLPFGMHSIEKPGKHNLLKMELQTEKTLALLEEKYPFDFWLSCCYTDDEKPNLRIHENMALWNRKWKWPRMQSVGNIDILFDRLRSQYNDQIAVLKGDITGGWYQLPPSAPDYLADKFEEDRTLPNVEKLAVITGMENPSYRYPADLFDRAWKALLYNDEHSYGTSSYQGKKVYETWMQHRDWIHFVHKVNEQESDRALQSLGRKINMDEESLLLFNPVAFPRKELVKMADGNTVLTPEIPAFGYKAVPLSLLEPVPRGEACRTNVPPVIENDFYRIKFAFNGSFLSVFDKEFQRELFDRNAPFQGNEFVYTKDNHQTFVTPPDNAEFELRNDLWQITVDIRLDDPCSGASIHTCIALPKHEKRIDITNKLFHVRDLFNKKRYFRYGYYAFPFFVEHAARIAHLNGCSASPGKEGQTGHGTETYLAAREWSCVENTSFGAALLQMDSQLVEFDRIHPDKTDAFMNEKGSSIYSFLFNDWLQKHTPGGSHIDLTYRYTIVSYGGSPCSGVIPQMAERMANPLIRGIFEPHTGTLPPEKSYLTLPEGLRLLALKRADDGKGVILRIKENHGKTVSLPAMTLCGKKSIRNSVDERPLPESGICLPWGSATYRFPEILLAKETLSDPLPGDTPAEIGSFHTGLIASPRAGNGAEDGVLYLNWGQNMEEELSHYELYRSMQSGFTPDNSTFLAKVECGPYRVVSYEDCHLQTHKRYYYRVCAVFRNGRKGPVSKEFSGITLEPPAESLS